MIEHAPRRERQDAVANRARILATAQELFARDGVEAVSMNRIAHEASVGTGTLYRHFANKSELCFALIQDQIVELASELSTLVSTCDDDPRAALEDMILRHQRFKEGKAPLFEGMQEAVAHRDGPTRSPVYEILRAPFVELFEKATRVEAGKPCPDAVFRADMLLSLLIGRPVHPRPVEQAPTTEAFAHGLCEIFYPRA